MLPPGPDRPPVLQLWTWLRSPLTLLYDAHRHHGDIFTIRFPFAPYRVVMVSDPEAIKDVLSFGYDDADAGPAALVLKPFVGTHSLLLLDGAEHARQRKMMMPAFHGERMQAYGASMINATDEEVDRMPMRHTFSAHKSMQAITLKVILEAIFGVDAPRFHDLTGFISRALDISSWPGLLFPIMQKDYGPFSPWARWIRIRDKVTSILRTEIRRARRDEETGRAKGRQDVLAMMIAARDENNQPLSEEEIHDELVTLVVAGHETTATSLAWALRWILPDRTLLRRLREEIATADGDPQKIAKLELLDATTKETLRMQPVVPLIGRVLREEKTVLGYKLPRGTLVSPAIPLVHQRPSLYPHPDRFDPDRFIGKRFAQWEWMPFGGGIRRCIGASFATYEMKMVLATLLPRVDMHLAVDRVRTVRRSITLAPEHGLRVVVDSKRPRRARQQAA